MNDLQKLAIAQALYKAIAEAVGTKDPGSLRSRMDGQIIANYGETGAKNFDIMLNGMKVGTYSIRFSKAAHYHELIVKDREAFIEWCCDNGLAKVERSYSVKPLNEEMTEAERQAYQLLMSTGVITAEDVVHTTNFALDDAKRSFESTGEVPAGCEVEAIDEESEPIGTTLRVDPKSVAKAMGEDLPGAVIGLLSEGGDVR